MIRVIPGPTAWVASISRSMDRLAEGAFVLVVIVIGVPAVLGISILLIGVTAGALALCAALVVVALPAVLIARNTGKPRAAARRMRQGTGGAPIDGKGK